MMENEVENEVKYIEETCLFGWKGSMFFGIILLTGLIGAENFGEVCLILSGASGWFGWAMQEYQHLNGYIIRKRVKK